MSNLYSVCIIGSGLSGLGTADVFRRLGARTTIFEQSNEIGGNWSTAYPKVTTQNTFREYCFPTFPWPFKPELHPTGDQLKAYIKMFVDKFNIDVQINHSVVATRLLPDKNNSWEVKVKHGETIITYNFDKLVVATGQFSDPKLQFRPNFENEHRFKGQILTRFDFKSYSSLKDQRVGVVGFGKTALDLSCLAADASAASVSHIFRTPRWALQRDIFGVHICNLILARANSFFTPSWFHPSKFETLFHQYVPVAVNGLWKLLETITKTVIQRQIAGCDEEGRKRVELTIPKHPLINDLRTASPLAPMDYYKKVSKNQITPYHSEIVAFTEDGVVLKDGTELPLDILVICAGVKPPTFPFLPPEHRALLESEPDGPQLYRHLVHPDIPNFAIAGFNHSFVHFPGVELGALWVHAFWTNDIVAPSQSFQREVCTQIREWKRAHHPHEPTLCAGVNIRFQQYLDAICKELNLRVYRKMPNIFAEVGVQYYSSDYAEVVDEYIQDRARRNGKLLQSLPFPF